MSYFSRVTATFVLALLLITPFASAKAATTAELQAQIAALLAQIAALQGGSSAGGSGTTSTGATTPARSSITVTPDSGNPPLNVTATMTVDMGTTTCGAVQMGTIAWGDGKSDKVVSENTGCAREKKDSISHSFQYVNDYRLKFTDLRNEVRTVFVGVYVEGAPQIYATSVTASTNDAGTLGTYTLVYDITANDGDIYIPTTSGKAGGAGTVYAITGSPLFAGTDVSVVQSTAKRSGKYFVVREGETKRFTLTVTLDPRSTGEYKVRLSKVGYAGSAKAPTAALTIDPKETNFLTSSIKITEPTSAGTTAAPWATIDPKNLRITTKNPILTGSVGGATTVGISIGNGDKVFGSGPIKVINGRWSSKVTTDLANGTYSLQVYSANNVELAKGTMQVKLASTTSAN